MLIVHCNFIIMVGDKNKVCVCVCVFWRASGGGVGVALEKCGCNILGCYQYGLPGHTM
jgi:hypothetical protein